MTLTTNAASLGDVRVPIDGFEFRGALAIPVHASGVVVFAHRRGGSRLSSRHARIARELLSFGCGTLLLDLLTTDEQCRSADHADLELLTHRLREGTEWLRAQPEAAGLPIGYFGAQVEAAAALRAAAASGIIEAIVLRAARLDLVWNMLDQVHAPTLLLFDEPGPTHPTTRSAMARLGGETQIEVILSAHGLVGGAKTAEEVAQHASRWFGQHLVPQRWRSV